MRDDDPVTGRYLQPDPPGLVDGASVYGYVGQSPMVWTDPRGEQTRGGTSGFHGRRFRCGRYIIVCKSDRTKGEHCHWGDSSNGGRGERNCVRRDGSACENSKPPPREVRRCLQERGLCDFGSRSTMDNILGALGAGALLGWGMSGLTGNIGGGGQMSIPDFPEEFLPISCQCPLGGAGMGSGGIGYGGI